MAQLVAFVSEGSGDGFDAEGSDAVEVGLDGALAFAGVALEHLGRDGRGIDEGVVEDGIRCADCGGAVLQDFFYVLRGGEAERLVGLGHEIGDVDAGGRGGGDGFGDSADEEVGDEGGVKGAGTEGDEVGVGDGVKSLGQRVGGGGVEHELVDAELRASDVGFAADDGTIFHAGGEGDVGGGGGVDAAAGGEDVGGGLDGLGEVSGDVGEGGEEEIAEGVAFEVTLLEAVLEEAGEEVLVFGESDHAVADVAGGKHFEVFAEAAGGASVVGNGDYGGEVADEAGEVGQVGAAVGGVRGTEPGGGVDGAASGYGGGDEVLKATKQSG